MLCSGAALIYRSKMSSSWKKWQTSVILSLKRMDAGSCSCRTAFDLLIRVSTSLFCFLSLVNTTPTYLNFSTCCSVLPLICRTHWLGFLERYNTSVFLVLIIIPTWPHAPENHSSVCWKLVRRGQAVPIYLQMRIYLCMRVCWWSTVNFSRHKF